MKILKKANQKNVVVDLSYLNVDGKLEVLTLKDENGDKMVKIYHNNLPAINLDYVSELEVICDEYGYYRTVAILKGTGKVIPVIL